MTGRCSRDSGIQENICKEYMQGKIPVPVLKNINFSVERSASTVCDHGSFRFPEKQH